MLPVCWPSLGSNWAILSDLDVITFFRKDLIKWEGRNDAHPLIKTPPAELMKLRVGMARCTSHLHICSADG